MRTSTTQARQGRARVGTIVLALLAAAAMVGFSMGPAFSDDHDQRDRDQKRGHRVYRPAPRVYPSYGFYQPYGYYQAPPPVVYVPPPSPGISLFFGFPRR